MGENRFGLSCMKIPNSWLYKLREMTKPKRIKNGSKISENAVENIPNLPRLKISPPSLPNLENYIPKRASQYIPTKERLDMLSKFSTQQNKLEPKSKPIGPVSFDIKSKQTSTKINLKPILTKPRKSVRKIKVRSIWPRCNPVDKKRRWLSESSLVEMSSSNPEKDFTESMVKMIVEKNIVRLKDLDELLVCYLYLNAREHHEVILKVYDKIWLILFKASYID
ncbi:transcription repressor [Rhynchospora pubera]|uniref:Transcription repressor n=1 Tax=Rhynchospora pubera TaxID=906938 RepID=A0AAV8E338_9POAL|nr:transcription repressor [Rhynchospora pubera]